MGGQSSTTVTPSCRMRGQTLTAPGRRVGRLLCPPERRSFQSERLSKRSSRRSVGRTRNRPGIVFPCRPHTRRRGLVLYEARKLEPLFFSRSGAIVLCFLVPNVRRPSPGNSCFADACENMIGLFPIRCQLSSLPFAAAPLGPGKARHDGCCCRGCLPLSGDT